MKYIVTVKDNNGFISVPISFSSWYFFYIIKNMYKQRSGSNYQNIMWNGNPHSSKRSSLSTKAKGVYYMPEQLSQKKRRSPINWKKANLGHIINNLLRVCIGLDARIIKLRGWRWGNQGSDYSPLQWSILTVPAVTHISLHYTLSNISDKNMRGRHWRAGVHLNTAYHI